MNFETKCVTAELKKSFNNCYDFSVREIVIGGKNGEIRAYVCYLDGLVSGVSVADTIIRPATDSSRFTSVETESEAIDLFLTGAVYSYTL